MTPPCVDKEIRSFFSYGNYVCVDSEYLEHLSQAGFDLWMFSLATYSGIAVVIDAAYTKSSQFAVSPIAIALC